MRKITSHSGNALNDSLEIRVMDARGSGGANHEYMIVAEAIPRSGNQMLFPLRFQNGPILEAGVNGISNEALLAVVEDRLLGFQSGKYACRENAVALTKIQEAMMWLQKRTRDREARGVEGTSQK